MQVDEQQTIQSQVKSPERPTVQNIFGPPPPSDPVDVPHSSHDSKSSSAPAAHTLLIPSSLQSGSPDIKIGSETLSIGGSSTDEGDDEFARLRESREQERINRLMQKLSRSVSIQAADAQESDQLLQPEDREGTVINVVPQKPFDDAVL